MYITIICNYCNKRWDQYVYNTTKKNFKCSKCHESKSFTILKAASESVDYYIGTPEFDKNIKAFEDSYDNYELVSNREDTELTSD